jgi:peptide-methionine (S)-S-oxide reductase
MRLQTVMSFAVAMLAAVTAAQAGAQPVVVPEPTFDEIPADATMPSIAVFAGGCFWGVQGVYQHVEGVLKAVSGYAGGAAESARYELVGEGGTGHAESVQITYDPTRISYGKLLQISLLRRARPHATKSTGA